VIVSPSILSADWAHLEPAVRQAEAAFPALVQQLVGEHPMARMATEEEIAGATLWLCSDGAGYVTGAPLAVDGGFLAA